MRIISVSGRLVSSLQLSASSGRKIAQEMGDVSVGLKSCFADRILLSNLMGSMLVDRRC